MDTLRHIRTMLAAFAALGVTFFFAGCMQIEQVVNVKPDGSGTVVLSLKMSKETLAQLKGLGGPDGQGDPMKDAFKDEEVKEQAKKLGEGVKFEKVEVFSDDKWEGKRAIFSFTDVNKLTMDLDMKNMTPGDQPLAEGKKEAAAFAFTKGSPSTLVIKIKQPEGAAAAEVQTPEEDDAQMAMMQGFLKDMRMTAAVNIEGKIVSTDAAAVDGSRIVLMDLPVGELIKDKAKFKALNKANDWKKLAELLKDVPGAKIESKPEVKVQFE